MKNNKQIPLLAKLMISFECDNCGDTCSLGWFYKGMDKLQKYITDDGKLVCIRCKEDMPKATGEVVKDKPLDDKEKG